MGASKYLHHLGPVRRMQVDDVGVQNFLKWFENAGGSLSGSVGVTQFPGMGQGAIAVQNIAASTFCPEAAWQERPN
jgi:hypothetical protein